MWLVFGAAVGSWLVVRRRIKGTGTDWVGSLIAMVVDCLDVLGGWFRFWLSEPVPFMQLPLIGAWCASGFGGWVLLSRDQSGQWAGGGLP